MLSTVIDSWRQGAAPSSRRLIRSPLAVGVLAVILAFLWQFLTVRYNYHGRWSALFYIGDSSPRPPALALENPYVFQNNPGYDGAFYHLIAHDPLFKREFAGYVDDPSLRWRRILIPGLAHIAALGNDRWVDVCYRIVNLMFVFAGAFWLSRYCAVCGLARIWGLGFLVVPSVVVSLDRSTIDVALAALTIGFILYAREGPVWKVYPVLVLCPLARETGLCLTLGQMADHVGKGEWKRLGLAAITVLPFVAWAAFVHWRTPADRIRWLSYPLAGIIRRTLTPVPYQIIGRWVTVAAALDYLALLGVWLALIFAFRLAMKRPAGILEASIVVFAFAAVWLGKADAWNGAYEFGRTMSPLLILLGLLAIAAKKARYLLPLGLVVPRVAAQLLPQLWAILRSLMC